MLLEKLNILSCWCASNYFSLRGWHCILNKSALVLFFKMYFDIIVMSFNITLLYVELDVFSVPRKANCLVPPTSYLSQLGPDIIATQSTRRSYLKYKRDIFVLNVSVDDH